MPLTTLNLTVELSLNSAYDTLVLSDVTGLYNATTNPYGYGSTNGVAVNDVTGLVVTLNYTTLALSAVYTFTVVNGTIAAATISFNSLGAENIITQINTTTFPLSGFNFLNTYVTGSSDSYIMPELEDGAYSVSYRITGNALVGGISTPFDLSATDMTLQKLATQCCIDEAFNNADIDCNCDDKKVTNAEKSKTYLDIALYAAEIEDSAKANLFINKAKTICDCECGC